MPNEQGAVPEELKELSERLEQWRKQQPPRTRLPESIWREAAELAGRFGLHQTTKLLRLDYTRLKKRVSTTTAAVPAAAKFVELLGSSATTAPVECVVEWESARGRMRVAMKGVAPDWTSLLRAWREG
jgi:hypothetical protein